MTASIVVPAYKATSTIGRTLASCAGNVRPEDVFVVLDGPDPELEAAARAAAPRAEVIVLADKPGAPVCRNAGLARVRTPFVMFLDADDYIEGPMMAPACADAERTCRDVMLAPFAFEWPDGRRQNANPVELFDACDNAHVMRRWLSGDYVPPCSVVWRTEFVRQMGGWDVSLAKNQDGDLMYRALMSGARVGTGACGLGIYSQDDNPLRITRTVNERTLTSQLAVLDNIAMHASRLSMRVEQELAVAYYGIARLAYGASVDHLGYRAFSAARELGLRGQPGSLGHSISAALFGLRGKQKIAKFVRRFVPPAPERRTAVTPY